MQHVDEGTLQAWLDGETVGPEDRAHLDSCPVCAERLEELRALDARAAEILGGNASSTPLPDFAAVQRRAEQLQRSTPPRRRWKAPAWAASVVIALGVGWMAREIADQGAVARPESLQAPAPVFAPAGGADAAEQEAAERTQEATPELADDFANADRAVGASGAGAVAAREEVPTPADAVAPEPTLSEVEARAPAPSPAAEARQPAAALPPPQAVPGAVAPDEASARLAAERPAEVHPPTSLRGRVTGENGAALRGAQVHVEGTAIGALVASDGSFTLPLEGVDVRDSIVLEVTMIGFHTERLALGLDADGAEGLDIRLTEQAIALEGVVVTGAAEPARREEAAALAGQRALDAARPAGDADLRRVVTLDVSALAWSPVSRTEAEALLGFAMLAPDGRAPDAVAIGTGPAAPAARYLLPGGPNGEAVTVYQSREAVGLGPDGLPAGRSAVTRRIDGVWVLATGPVDSGVLEALLDTLR